MTKKTLMVTVRAENRASASIPTSCFTRGQRWSPKKSLSTSAVLRPRGTEPQTEKLQKEEQEQVQKEQVEEKQEKKVQEWIPKGLRSKYFHAFTF